MCVVQGCGRLQREGAEPGPFRFLPTEAAEGFAQDQFHGDEGGALHLTGLKNVGDVGMVELARHLGFLDQGPVPRLVHVAQDLEGYFALQPQIQCPPDGPHGAFAQSLDQAVGTENLGIGVQTCTLKSPSLKYRAGC